MAEQRPDQTTQAAGGAQPSRAVPEQSKASRYETAARNVNAKRAGLFAAILEPGEKIEVLASGLTSKWWAVAEWLIIPGLLGMPKRATRELVVTDRHVYLCRGSGTKVEVLSKIPRDQASITGKQVLVIQPDLHRGVRGVRLEVQGIEKIDVRPTDRSFFDARDMIERASGTASPAQ